MLEFDRRGSGPLLVLLHPLGADRTVWEPIRTLLDERRETLAVDLPGFGGSAPLAGEPTPAALARAVADGLRSAGVEHYDVAGNSLGAWIALELALRGHARSVTALAPAGLWARPLAPKRALARQVARLTLPLLERSPSMRRRALASVALHPERIPPQASRAIVRSYATAPGFDAVNAAMRANVFGGLAALRVPATLAWAEHDTLVRAPRSLPAGIESVLLRGCGHLPMWDDPQRIVELLLATSERAAGQAASSAIR